MAGPKLITVTRTQGNNEALKDGTVRPKTFEPEYLEVEPIIAAFRRMVRGNEFDISEMAITTYICARAHGKPMTAVPVAIRMSVTGACRSSPIPCLLSVNANGKTNAGSVYFHVSIIVGTGFAPVMAAAANGESAVGGLTSESTA